MVVKAIQSASNPRSRVSTTEGLPKTVRNRADKSFALLTNDPRHPSLNFKPVGCYCRCALEWAIAP